MHSNFTRTYPMGCRAGVGTPHPTRDKVGELVGDGSNEHIVRNGRHGFLQFQNSECEMNEIFFIRQERLNILCQLTG